MENNKKFLVGDPVWFYIRKHDFMSKGIIKEIFVLDNGNIVETGCHEDLIKKGGIYAHMYKEQSKWYK